MKRTISQGLAAALIATAAAAWGLINPQVTPKDFAARSSAVAELRLGPLAKDRSIPVRIIKAHKGEAPAKLALVAGELEQTLEDALTRALPSQGEITAVYFASRVAPGADSGRPVGALVVGSYFYGLYRGEGDVLKLGNDTGQLRTIWAGSADMLVRLMEAVKADPQLNIPVRSAARWHNAANLGKVEGKVRSVRAVELGGNTTTILVLSDAGDRAFERNAAAAWQDVTAKRKLTGKSQLACFGDFTGHGRIDMAAWDGQKLWMWEQAGDGTFAGKPFEGGPRDVRSLATAEGRGGKVAAIVAGTQTGPVWIELGSAQAATLTHVPPQLGAGGASASADFDGDGIADVLAVFEKGAAFYKGQPAGFAKPVVACTAKLSGAAANIELGDFDADGRLDAAITGDGGTALLRNLGEGKFLEQVVDSGEIGYDDKLDAVSGAAVDFNHDGRLDMVLAFADKTPFNFFNRGFYTFGVSNDLLYAAPPDTGEAPPSDTLTPRLIAASREVGNGQQAIAPVDGNAVAIVTTGGQAWYFAASPDPERKIVGLRIAADATQRGPRNVVVKEGARNLGARVVRPGEPAWFAMEKPGEATVIQSPAEKRLKVDGISRITLGQ